MTHFKSALRTFSALALAASLLLPHTVHAADPSLTLSPDSTSVTLGQDVILAIMVDTAGYASGGVGAILRYDPNLLVATHIETGTIFVDYPLASIDNTNGKITISGIAASTNDLYTGRGELARVTFNTRQVGIDTLSFEFTPGSTRDSNIAVTFGSGDVLASVGQAKITVLETSNNVVLPSPPPPVQTSLVDKVNQVVSTVKIPYLRDKYASARAGREVSKNLDPLGPIVRQEPITDPLTTQPTASVNNVNVEVRPTVNLPLIGAILAIIAAIIVVLYRRRSQNRYYR